MRRSAQLEQRALASGRAFEPITVDVNKDGTVANITVPIAGNGTDAASNAAFRMLRETVVPETVGALPDTEAGVTGQTAEWRDQADELKSNLPPVVAFVLLFAFSLMLVAFRSIVIAIKAILLNLLSVAAAYGVLVLVFQHGLGKGLLGISSTAGIEAVVPLLLFVILFGLSMDYHVFIISRIRETYDRGKSMDEAVSYGIKSTAGVVTSAATRHGRRLRGLRDALDAVLQAVRRRARGRDPDRRHDRPRGAPARVDEAARRLELVPPHVARVASDARAREDAARARARALGVDPESSPRPLKQGAGDSATSETTERNPLMTAHVDKANGTAEASLHARPHRRPRCSSGSWCAGSGTSASPPTHSISVPKGAQAGDLSLDACTYATENGSYAADCGTLVVPENRADPRFAAHRIAGYSYPARGRRTRQSRSSASRAAPALRT